MKKFLIGTLVAISLGSGTASATVNESTYEVGEIVSNESLNESAKDSYAIILENDWVTTRIRSKDMKVVEVDHYKPGFVYKNLIIGNIYSGKVDNFTVVGTGNSDGFTYVTFEEKNNNKCYTRIKLDYSQRIVSITFIDKNL